MVTGSHQMAAPLGAAALSGQRLQIEFDQGFAFFHPAAIAAADGEIFAPEIDRFQSHMDQQLRTAIGNEADGVAFSYHFSKTSHDDQHVKLFAYGFEADFSSYNYYASHYLIKNTDVYRMMRRLLEGEAA